MSGNLQRQAGITETKAGLTAKAQTPINLILEVMGDEMNASIHAPVSQRPWMAGSDHCAGMHRCRKGHGWPGATTSGHHYSQLLTTNLNFPALTDCVLSGASDGCPRFTFWGERWVSALYGSNFPPLSLSQVHTWGGVYFATLLIGLCHHL